MKEEDVERSIADYEARCAAGALRLARLDKLIARRRENADQEAYTKLSTVEGEPSSASPTRQTHLAPGYRKTGTSAPRKPLYKTPEPERAESPPQAAAVPSPPPAAPAPEPTGPLTEAQFMKEAGSTYNRSKALQREFHSDRESYLAYMAAVFRGDIKPEDALAASARVHGHEPPSSPKGSEPALDGSLDLVLSAASQQFDNDRELQREFAATEDPRATWLSFVKAEHARQARVRR